MKTQVLVVDDVPAMAEQYAYDLKRVGGYSTIVAAGGDEALDLFGREPVDCVVLDLEMPGIDGFEVLGRLQHARRRYPVIVYTGTGNYDRCAQAVRLGAYGFVDKAEPIERVVQEIENAVERGRLVTELHTLRPRFDGETPLIGEARRCARCVMRSGGSHRFRAPSSSWGERHRQGARRARAASRWRPGRESRSSRSTARRFPNTRRERAVRSRARRVHRRRSAAPRRVRERRRRDVVSRRSRRAAAAGAGQAASRARGADR